MYARGLDFGGGVEQIKDLTALYFKFSIYLKNLRGKALPQQKCIPSTF